MSGLPFVLFVCCTELCLAAILGAGVLPLAGVIVGSCARRIGVGRGAKRGATSGAGLAAALVMGQWLQSVWSPGGPNKYLSGYEWRRLATQELPGVGRITTHEIYLAADRRHWNSMTGAHRPLLANQLVPFGLSLPPAEPGTKRWVVLVSWGGAGGASGGCSLVPRNNQLRATRCGCHILRLLHLQTVWDGLRLPLPTAG